MYGCTLEYFKWKLQKITDQVKQKPEVYFKNVNDV